MHLWAALREAAILHPATAAMAVFLISFTESLALIGLIVPGTALMIGVGALAGSGALALKTALFAAMLGAIAGDGVSYWLGHRFSTRLKEFWPFRKHPQMLARSEEFIRRHGGKSVFIGRFIGPIRPTIPVAAGMLDMPPGRFAAVNILSSIGWALAYLLPGFLLGSSIALVNAVSARLSLLIIILMLTIWLVFWFCRKALGLLDRFGPKGERLLPLLCLALVLSGWLFLGILEDVLTLDPLVRADQAVFGLFQALRTPWTDRLLTAVTELGDGVVVFPVAVIVLIVLLSQRKFRPSKFWFIAVAGGLSLVEIFKWLLHRPRPITTLYQGVSHWAFPSGHSAISAVIYGFLAVLLVRSFEPRRRWLPFAAALGISLIIAFSRLYLGAHWLSDVLGGLSLGWAWTALLGILYLRGEENTVPKGTVLLAGFSALLLAGTWNIHNRHNEDLVRYRTRNEVQSLSAESWLKDDWQKLPAWRIDLAGETEQPITFQWAGDPERLASLLEKQNWSRPEGLNFKQLANLFVPGAGIRQLPMLPLLENGRTEQLLMQLPHDDRRLTLRLWPSEYKLSQTGQPIWLGTVQDELAKPLTWLLTLPRGSGNFSDSLTKLKKSLERGETIEEKQRKADSGGKWDGAVLLVWDKQSSLPATIPENGPGKPPSAETKSE